MNQHHNPSNKDNHLSKASQHLSKYIIESEIGRGASGVCYKVHHINQKKPFVMKKILINSHPLSNSSTFNKNNNSRLKAALSQVHLLSQLNHPNIIKYYDSFADEQYLYIVMQYAPKGDLHRILKRRKIKGQSYEQKDIWNMMQQILHALSYLHQNNIIHRDVKTLNVMVASDNTLMLGDLGVSKMVQNQLALYSRVGTPLYLAPEIIKYEKYDYKADVWGAGCIGYILATLTHPFQGKNIISLGQNIVSIQQKHINYFLGSTSSTKYSEQLNSFISEMLEKDPSKRPSVDNLLKKYFSFQKDKSNKISGKDLTSKYQLIKQKKYINFSSDQSKRSLLDSIQSPISKRKQASFGIKNQHNQTIKIVDLKKKQDQINISNKIGSQISIEQYVHESDKVISNYGNKKPEQKSKQSQIKYVQIQSNRSVFLQRQEKAQQSSKKNNEKEFQIQKSNLDKKSVTIRANQAQKQCKQKAVNRRPITALRNNYFSKLKPQKQFKSSTNVNKIILAIEQNYIQYQKQGISHKANSSYQLRKNHRVNSRQRLNSQFEQNTVIKPYVANNLNGSRLNNNQEITYVKTRQGYNQKQSESAITNKKSKNHKNFGDNYKRNDDQIQKRNVASASYSLRNRNFYQARAKNSDMTNHGKITFQRNQIQFYPDQIMQDQIQYSVAQYEKIKAGSQDKQFQIIQSTSKFIKKEATLNVIPFQQRIQVLDQLCKRNVISIKNTTPSQSANVIKTEQVQTDKYFKMSNNQIKINGNDNFFQEKSKKSYKNILPLYNINSQEILTNIKRLKSSQNCFVSNQKQVAQERNSEAVQKMKGSAQIKYYRPRPQTSINRKYNMIKDVKRKKGNQSSDVKHQAVHTQILKKPEVILL